MSSNNKDTDDAEDIPSDFFDDFSKEEFMAGLSVVDSWDDEAGKPRGARINAEALDSVQDLRELIREGREEERGDRSYRRREERDRKRRSSSMNLDEYIKPGSRRDPSKTNEAIRRDKEVKVKQYLAKKIESSDDLRPPGTELDDYLDEKRLMDKKPTEERSESRRSVEKHRHESPRPRERESPRQKRRRYSRSPRRSPRRSPIRQSRSPLRSRYRPAPPWPGHGHSNRRFPYGARRSRSPRRVSPRRSPRWERPRSRSPRRDRSRSPRRDRYRHSRSRSAQRDTFLYPDNMQPMAGYPPDSYPGPLEMFPGPGMDYPPHNAPGPGYPFQPPSGFPGGFGAPYDYGPQMGVPGEVLPPVPVPVPQPVPAPMMAPGPMMVPGPVPGPMPPQPVPMPAAAPAHPEISPARQPTPSNKDNLVTPFDALAQLVAEGKLSQEDYLKLAPNKSKSARFVDASAMDNKTRVQVITRCQTALQKLAKLKMPNHLMINLGMLGPEPKALPPKFCSPLKRQVTTDFHFTTPNPNAAAAHNKQLIDSVIAAIGLTNVVARPKKKTPKNMKDAAVQTTKPYCDVCEIREATHFYDATTSIDPEHFSSSIHTQVVEQDLLSSKSMFAPSGSMGDGATMSIAHLTPAQLVSQLAARAKTLKQTEPSPTPYGRRNPPGNYDYDDRGGQQYQNYNNYNRY